MKKSQKTVETVDGSGSGWPENVWILQIRTYNTGENKINFHWQIPKVAQFTFSMFSEPVLQLGAESSAIQAAAHGGRTRQVSSIFYYFARR
jgi:hypothetical protein